MSASALPLYTVPTAAQAESELPRGEIIDRTEPTDGRLGYYLYVPESLAPDARVLVTVHGISRNAREHVRRFSRRADRYGVILVAPLFDRDSFPDYQRLGRAGQGPRADRALNGLLEEVSGLLGRNLERVYLFGYSGGGQFVHRFALAYPDRVAGVAIGAAGWYTFPDATRLYPYGVAESDDLPGMRFDPERFLTVPACVFVGERDIERDVELRSSSRVDRQQGTNRLERGQRWLAAMEAAARSRGLRTTYRFEVLPESGHSFAQSVRNGGLARQVFRCLFGPAPSLDDGTAALDTRPCAVRAPQAAPLADAAKVCSISRRTRTARSSSRSSTSA